MKRELTCIICPVGCELSIVVDDNTVKSITGNKCKKGVAYGSQEMTNPMRTIASSALVVGGELELVSVRVTQPIPKAQIFNVMNEIKKVRVKAPVRTGDIIISNVLGLNSDIIATKDII